VKQQHPHSILSHNQINHIRNSSIKNVISAFESDPSATSMGRLIQLFSFIPTVSYVYVTHKPGTGFVKHYKGKKHQTTEDNVPICHDDLKIFRQNQGPDTMSIEVVVIFAWSHDEEIRNFNLFPEFTAWDLTFGTNKEQRPQMLLSGMTGTKKAFTALRAFMPNKSKEAYSWILRVALPTLMGKTAVQSMRCIASDMEENLAASIEEAKNAGSIFKFIKHRLDYFHVFEQPWRKDCRLGSGASMDLITTHSNIHNWITSWFNYCETKEEFDVSYRNLNIYLGEKKDIIGSVLLHNIKTLIGKVLSRLEKCAHYIFKDIVTYGFIGSMLVEVSNIGVKRGHFKATSSQKVDKSAWNQIKQAESRSVNLYKVAAEDIKRKKLWSGFSSGNMLTAYAEGVACVNYDVVHSKVSPLPYLPCIHHLLQY